MRYAYLQYISTSTTSCENVMYSNVYWHNTYTKQVNIPVVVKQKHAAHKTIAESMKT